MTATALSPSQLSRLSELIADETGVHFAQHRWRDMEKGLSHAAAELGYKNVGVWVDRLLSLPPKGSEIEVLASHITVGETYFFRDPRLFRALEEHVLPDLIRTRQQSGRCLRIWSAGCCTGEEPYSLAILLRQLIPNIDQWNILILGTDINRRFLQKAGQGKYGSWSFRGVPETIRQRYFRTAQHHEFELRPEIQSRVTFAYLNLMRDVYPSLLSNTNAMDIIICRNVLMYFDSKGASEVVRKLQASLVDGGWLIASPSELSHTLFAPLTTVNLDGTVLYRKLPTSATPATLDYGEVPSSRPGASSTPEPLSNTFPDTARGSLDSIASMPLWAAADYAADAPTDLPTTLAAPKSEACFPVDKAGRENDSRAQAASDACGDDPATMRMRARDFANGGHLDESLLWCNRAIQADRLNPGNYYLRALILREQGLAAEAMTSLRQTLYLDPKFVVAYFALGDLSRVDGQFEETAKHWRNALALLKCQESETIIPDSDGMTAGRLRSVLESALIEEGVR